MKIRTEKKDFDGIQFSTTTFAAMRALEIMALIDDNWGPKEMSQHAATIFEQTSAIVTDQLGQKQIPLNSRENLDLVFSGRLPILFKVFSWVQEVNFGNFAEGNAPVVPPTPTTSGS